MPDFSEITQSAIASLEGVARRVCDFEAAHERIPTPEEILTNDDAPLVQTIERAPFAVTLHRDGRARYLNATAASVLGSGHRRQLIGRPLESFLHPDSLRRASELLSELEQRTTADGSAEVQLLHLDGHPVHVVGLSMFVPASGNTFLSLFLDVSESKRAEAALRARERRYRMLGERASDLIAEVDDSGLLVYCSPNHERLLGYREEELLGSPPLTFVIPEDRSRPPEIAEGLPAVDLSYRAKRKDGSHLWLESTAVPFLTAEGRRHVVVISHDVSERMAYERRLEEEVSRRTEELERANESLRALQSELMASERLGAAEDLTASVVHAIGNPLAALVGTVELALEARSEADPTLERIHGLARRIRNVVDGTHQLFQRRSLAVERASAAGLIDELAAGLEERAKSQGVRIERRVHEPLPAVSIDPSALPSALRALGENALDAMPHGGTLQLDGSALVEARVFVLCLRDTGPGIPDEIRGRVLEPFFTTRGGAAGLGLAIERGIIQGLRGRLRIENHAKGGALVTVELPTRSD